MNQKPNDKGKRLTPFYQRQGMAIGTALGLIFGLMVDQIALGLVVGIAVGTGIGRMADIQANKEKK